jgi:lactate dehydrogenase-like 2-hydroxyacid dehydrogenase
VAYNAIDLAAAARAGVYVCNNAGVNARAVAEQAITLILALLKDFRFNEDAVYGGRQIDAKTSCFAGGITELGDCHVGIVGLGATGTALAERLRAFGCRLSYYSKTQKPERGIEYLPLQELYSKCDIVSLHVPVTGETENMIDDAALASFKRGAILVNTARGELMDHGAVVRALESGALGGLAADTLAPEPVRPDNPIIASLRPEIRRRVALSPHIGGITAGCFLRTYEHVWANVAAIERGERPDCVVNGV